MYNQYVVVDNQFPKDNSTNVNLLLLLKTRTCYNKEVSSKTMPCFQEGIEGEIESSEIQ